MGAFSAVNRQFVTCPHRPNKYHVDKYNGDKNKVLSPSDTCKTNQRKYQREMKVAPPFIKHCLHCLHCFDCLQCLSLPSQWHIHKCRPTYMMTLLTLLHSCMPYRFRSRKWDWLSGLQWSGWKTIMLRISISSMVFDIVGPLEARTSKFGGLSGARILGEDFPQHNRSKQPAVIAGC